ncbi:Glyoxylase, beta-lactamase superfamily II [Alteribacillus persepolensis]|uniref:Glyoxylase, beta-lactamase superfamily II n=1 Tax=Alteribacillus persepolensis TaxID=568899 RepID=A0A1G8ER88_9BACI|nr:MBL fold metallo-hydrolase [Alteribacillus persepolensis]SDH72394.1 Glyoxylase, beta-lactamase superfamily II [Alteribacillus persepolensis]
MELIHIKEEMYYLHQAVNIGYIKNNEQGLLIDTGIDKQTAKKAAKLLKEQGLPVTDIFITHAHTDHFGGAAWWREHHNVRIHASPLEKAIIEQPKLEPIYLFQGVDPVDDIRNKFLEGPPVTVDTQVYEGRQTIAGIEGEILFLPGHSYEQPVFCRKGVVYAADSYFAVSYLKKHRIPFMVDIEKACASLQQLLSLEAEGAVPGHGEYEQQFQQTVEANLNWHQQLLDEMEDELHKHSVQTIDALTTAFLNRKHISITQLSMFLLYRTAVLAYVKALAGQHKAQFVIQDNQWLIKPL